MKGIILAAGYATRLYPLTLDRPKALLEIAGVPIVERIALQMSSVGAISEILVVTNHKFAAHFYKWHEGLVCPKAVKILDDLTTSEETRLGAIGDIQFIIEREGIDEDVMIIAGDSIFTFELADFYDYYISTGKDCVVAKDWEDAEQLKRFAVAKLAPDDRILNLVEKPAQPESNTAIFAAYAFTRETTASFARYLAEGNKPDAPGYFVQWLYERTDVYAYRISGDIYDIGTKKAFDYVNELMEGKA